MTEHDLQRIERVLEVSLPGYYYSIQLEYPSELLKLADLIKDDDNSDPETPCDLELLNDLEIIIDMNKFVREPGHRYSKSGDPWPANYFLVGIDGCGNYYAIDLLKGDESPVFFWDHDTIEWDEAAPNIRDFIPLLIEQYYDYAREEGFID